MGDTALACFGRIPWIGRQGVRRARRRQSNDVDNDGGDDDNNGSDANDKDGSDDGNNDEGDADSNGTGNDDYDNNDVNNNNDDDGTTTMQWRQRQWNDNNLMVMGLRAMCHPSEATINLY